MQGYRRDAMMLSVKVCPLLYSLSLELLTLAMTSCLSVLSFPFSWLSLPCADVMSCPVSTKLRYHSHRAPAGLFLLPDDYFLPLAPLLFPTRTPHSGVRVLDFVTVQYFHWCPCWPFRFSVGAFSLIPLLLSVLSASLSSSILSATILRKVV